MDKKWKDTSVRNSALAVETRKRKGVRLIMSVLSLMTWLIVTVLRFGLKRIADAMDIADLERIVLDNNTVRARNR